MRQIQYGVRWKQTRDSSKGPEERATVEHGFEFVRLRLSLSLAETTTQGNKQTLHLVHFVRHLMHRH
jgi:hypothetical protein